MVSNVSQKAIDLCAYYECAGKPDDPKWLHAYLDSGGVATIGIGTIQYPNGQRVKMGDVITKDEMYEYFQFEIRNKVAKVNLLTRDDISQNAFDSLVDFSYNVGTTALQKSTLLKVLNKDLNNKAIVTHFLSWRFDNGQEMAGLTRRRMSEAYLYFSGQLKYDWINYKHYNEETVQEVLSALK